MKTNRQSDGHAEHVDNAEDQREHVELGRGDAACAGIKPKEGGMRQGEGGYRLNPRRLWIWIRLKVCEQ